MRTTSPVDARRAPRHASTHSRRREISFFFPHRARASDHPVRGPFVASSSSRFARVKKRNVPKLPNPPRSPPRSPRSPPPPPPAGLFLRCGGTYPLAFGAAGALAPLDDAGAGAGVGVGTGAASGTLNGGKSPESSAQLDMFCAVRRRRRTCALFTTKLARRVLGRAAWSSRLVRCILDFSFLIDGRFESIDENPLSRAFAKRIFIDRLILRRIG
jgi:hypothetical protein